MQILSVTSPEFLKYGRVIRHVEFGGLIREMKNTPVPQGVVILPKGTNNLCRRIIKKYNPKELPPMKMLF